MNKEGREKERWEGGYLTEERKEKGFLGPSEGRKIWGKEKRVGSEGRGTRRGHVFQNT